MKGISENPNDSSVGGTHHYASIIYAENSDPDDFPVKGFIVGGLKTIWSYSDCVAPDYGYTEPFYEQMFSSPNANERVGYVTRIEAEATSCNRKEVTAVTSITSSWGTGRNDLNSGAFNAIATTM